MSHPSKKGSRRRSQEIPSYAKELRIVGVIGLLAVTIAALAIYWEYSAPPERLVEVYRLHGCRCAFTWVNALRTQGFVVRMYEYQTLEYVRGTLHVPPNWSGCHVGKYLGYFVEGHVSASVLLELARAHPQGLGVAVVDSARQSTKESGAAAKGRVLLVELDGRSHPWLPPPSELKRDP